MSINIEQTLRERFAAPLPENYRRRIVFWQDPDGEFSDFVDELNLDGVKILKLTGKNNFAAKMTLSETDLVSHYLVYNPIAYADVREDWLLDIELYSEEFRADLISIRMQELGVSATSQMRRLMKDYSRFFENRDRVAKLKGLESRYSSAGQLHIDILSVLSGAISNSPSGVIRGLLMAGMDMENNAALTNIRKFGSEDVLWEVISRYTGYVHNAEQKSLLPLASHILITALSVTMDRQSLNGLEKLISEPNQQRCYDLVYEWLHSEDDQAYYDIAREVEAEHHLVRRFDELDVQALLNSECFPCINECILRRYMTEISEDVIKAGDILTAVERRRTLKWYDYVRHYYDGLYQVAQMQKFYQENVSGFHIAEPAELWKEYCKNYCKMDHFYRLFHTAFGRSLKESSSELDDLYKYVADYVEKLYKHWYLAALGGQWTRLIADELARDQRLPRIRNQEDFYRQYVMPIVGEGARAFVIISDALRYEVGVDLTSRLMRETKGSAKIDSVQSVFPSVTRFGMAALLPHRQMQLTAEGRVLCDGASTDGTENRGRILAAAHAGDVAMTYQSLIKMKKAERRAAISEAQVVYIYHNAIDAIGDKAATEDQVFEACEQAITEIGNLVRIIVNDMNGSHILITADHGFLYSYKPLEESDKAEKSFVSGNIVELERRYVIADGDCAADHMLRIPMTRYQSDWMGFAPQENIRMKKSGGGMNFVHGGVSLQEMVVPVVTFQNMRATYKKFVNVRSVELQLISQSRKVSNSIFSLDFYQKDAVSGKMAAATYDVYMADARGVAVSDHKTIIADRTSGNGADRVFRERFTLKGIEFKKTETYYLTIVERGTGDVVDKVEFTIDIAFMNDFDF